MLIFLSRSLTTGTALATALLGAAVAACSSGHLDLENKRRKPDPPPPFYLTEITPVPDFNDNTNSGLELYATDGFISNYQHYGQALYYGPQNQQVERYVSDSQTCTFLSAGTAVAAQGGSCLTGQSCITVNTSRFIGRTGKTPCTVDENAFTARLDRTGGTASIASSGEPLSRRSFAFRDGWKKVADAGAPPPLVAPAAYAVANQVLIWGKQLNGTYVGAIFDPAANTWKAVNSHGIPVVSSTAQSVWTGERLVLYTGAGDGAVYDPGADTWTALKAGGPVFDTAGNNGKFNLAYGDGKLMIWGASYAVGTGAEAHGALYDLTLNTWKTIRRDNAPSSANFSTAIWTGLAFVVWAPERAGKSIYYPQTDSWQPVQIDNGSSVSSDGRSSSIESSSTTPAAATLVLSPQGVVALSLAESVPKAWYFASESVSWNKVNLFQPFTNDHALAPRLGASATTVDGMILVYGGVAPTLASASLQNFAESRHSTLLDAAEAPATSSSTPAISTSSAFHGGGFIYDVAKEKLYALPTGNGALSTRSSSATILVGHTLFVWGGCGSLVSDNCEAYVNDGAMIEILLP